MTTNEIAERDDSGSSLELFPPAQMPTSAARAMLHEHARMYGDAAKLAGALVKTSMVPKRFFDKAGDATAAILYGAELGLNPIQSLQRVVAIHGMPSLESRTMVGLLKSRGYRIRTVEQSDTSVTVEGIAPDGETTKSTWTIQRAIQAGYVPIPSSPDSKRRPDVQDDWVTVSKTWNGKTTKSVVGNMKYITDPQTMLKAKGQAEVCRELAPDVLMGISYSREELESEDQRQFDRMDERGAAPARTYSAPVTVDEIFAEEVPLSADGVTADGNPPAAHQVPDQTTVESTMTADEAAEAVERGKAADAAARQRIAERTAPETPAGDVTQDQGDGAPDPEPSPAEQPQPVVEPAPKKAPAKKAAAKRSTAPADNPDKPKSRMRQALENRLFALCGEAGISGEKVRDGRIAVYRALLERPDITSTDDLDDPAVAKVADQLYAWSQMNELDDQIAGILSDAARDTETSAATAAEPTSEGNE